MANILSFAALGVCGVSVFFAFLALALPYWQTYELGSISVNVGLFRVCADTCMDVLDTALATYKSSIQGAQAMVLMGFFALVGSLVVFVLLTFVMKGRKMFGYIAGALALAGGFFLMVGMGIYADKLKFDGSNYGAGFAFDILGWFAGWGAGGIMLFITLTGSFES